MNMIIYNIIDKYFNLFFILNYKQLVFEKTNKYQLTCDMAIHLKLAQVNSPSAHGG
jgi:hypothetical protein